jgi:diguanylate cyclase (GGDEF)-like protein
METACVTTCEAGELQRAQLFQSASMKALKGLLQNCPVRKLLAGEQLLTRGQPNYAIYVLLSGRLRVHLDSGDADPLITLEGGECVGEMSVIDNQLASATVIAEESCRLLEISEDILWSLVDRSPAVARNLLRVLTRRLRHGNSVICRSRQLQRHFEQHAITDPLSGLFNRRWLEQALPRQMACCLEGGEPFSLLIADIDFFKDFNDSYGHLTGDRAISAIASTLMSSLRKSDQAVRFGGEEFLILLPGSDLGDARMIAERIRKTVRETPLSHLDGRPLPPITVSIGLAEMTPRCSAEALIARADEALYRAKQKGRDSVVG